MRCSTDRNARKIRPGEPGGHDAEPAIEIRAAGPDSWPLVERLFGTRGACGGCWCMHWDAPPGAAAWEAMKGEPNRRRLEAAIKAGTCEALLMLRGEIPVGWVRLGPAGALARLRRSRLLWRAEMADWAILCFYLAPAERKRGHLARLIEAAAAHAFARGARSIEGYPVVAAGRAMAPAFAWTGFPVAFETAGFRPVDHPSGARRIYRLDRDAQPVASVEKRHGFDT